jgi:hypothetical protein
LTFKTGTLTNKTGKTMTTENTPATAQADTKGLIHSAIVDCIEYVESVETLVNRVVAAPPERTALLAVKAKLANLRTLSETDTDVLKKGHHAALVGVNNILRHAADVLSATTETSPDGATTTITIVVANH